MTVRRISGFGSAAAVAAISAMATAPAHAECDVFSYSCVLTGQQETPVVASGGFGGGQFTIDTVANTVTYRIVFTGLTSAETAAHIHGYAGPGTPAGVVHPLPAGNPKVGVWNYAEADEANILAGNTYVNIHSANFGGGELRGQIVPLNASLTGAQDGTASAGQGWGVFTIDTTTNELDYHIEFAGLTTAETAAHIHGVSLHGTAAGVLFNLGTGTPKTGTWVYPEANEADILLGRTYVNVHSTMFPGGEIRGQIVPIVVPIDGDQETAPTGSPGAGIALVGIDTEANELGFDIRFANLSSAETAAHIHGFAPAGSPAGVLFGLPAGSPKIGTWTYLLTDEPGVLGGETYINIHSANHGGGEIRGQIEPFFCQPTVAVNDPVAVLDAFYARNYPNPFRASTTIEFELSKAAPVTLTVFDVSGRLVRTLVDASLGVGPHGVAWDGRDDAGRAMANGIYQYVLDTPEGRVSRRITLLR